MDFQIDVDSVAELAKIRLDEDEKESVMQDLAQIVAFARKLEEIDTEGTEITAHIVPLSNVLRDDVVTNSPDRDKLLENAPTKAQGFMTVPKTLE